MLNDCSLKVGWAMADITPVKSAALRGQFNDRFSNEVRSPLTTTALAVESVGGAKALPACFIMISFDSVASSAAIQEMVRQKFAQRVKGFDPKNIFIMAIHTHTAPYFARNDGGLAFSWPSYNPDIITPEEYADFMTTRMCDAAVEAWEKRQKGGMSHQLSYAVIGHNRWVVYDNGSARMYGDSNTVFLSGLEGPTDPGVELLYFWNEDKALTGIVANVACPSQVVESEYYISPDYWGEVRKRVWETFGSQVFVLPMCGAAGDQSPRDMVRRGRGDKNMYAEEGLVEISTRILNAIQYKYKDAQQDIDFSPVVKHTLKNIALPLARVSKDEYESAIIKFDAILKKYSLDKDHFSKDGVEFDDLVALFEAEGAIARFNEMNQSPVWLVESHFVRIGAVAICTNPFELYTEYGLRIKARSIATQTLIAQLACDDGGYLPTDRAIKGGHYSAAVASGKVGPESGKLYVDYTVGYINGLWDE